MEQIGNKWKAADGKFFVRKSDNKVMGDTLFLGEEDVISNYKEKVVSDQEREGFTKKYSFGATEGVEDMEASVSPEFGG